MRARQFEPRIPEVPECFKGQVDLLSTSVLEHSPVFKHDGNIFVKEDDVNLSRSEE